MSAVQIEGVHMPVSFPLDNDQPPKQRVPKWVIWVVVVAVLITICLFSQTPATRDTTQFPLGPQTSVQHRNPLTALTWADYRATG